MNVLTTATTYCQRCCRVPPTAGYGVFCRGCAAALGVARAGRRYVIGVDAQSTSTGMPPTVARRPAGRTASYWDPVNKRHVHVTVAWDGT